MKIQKYFAFLKIKIYCQKIKFNYLIFNDLKINYTFNSMRRKTELNENEIH